MAYFFAAIDTNPAGGGVGHAARGRGRGFSVRIGLVWVRRCRTVVFRVAYAIAVRVQTAAAYRSLQDKDVVGLICDPIPGCPVSAGRNEVTAGHLSGKQRVGVIEIPSCRFLKTRVITRAPCAIQARPGSRRRIQMDQPPCEGRRTAARQEAKVIRVLSSPIRIIATLKVSPLVSSSIAHS